MDGIVVRCPACQTAHRLPANRSGIVQCSACKERFLADTRTSDGKAVLMDQDTIDIVLAPFLEAAGLPTRAPELIESSDGLFGSKSARCPTCKFVIKGLSSGVPARCDRCGNYSLPKKGYLHPLEENFVSEIGCVIPMMTFERAERMPLVCCACGAPATRSIRLSVSHDVPMPYCRQHSAGAWINGSSTGPYGVSVKSYRFYREFMQTNGGLRS
ncbi:MAG: hypothetical protein ABL956_15865 [Hyphomonadaceae bacterium]